jgi:vacuolar-type H+-ATPase subunit H
VLSGTGHTDEEPDDTDRFTIEFDTASPASPEPISIWPTVIAALFVLCVVTFFVYLARPPILEPMIAKIESEVGAGSEKLANQMKLGKEYAEEQAELLLQNSQESVGAENIDDNSANDTVESISDSPIQEAPDLSKPVPVSDESLSQLDGSGAEKPNSSVIEAALDGVAEAEQTELLAPPELVSLEQYEIELAALRAKLDQGENGLSDYIDKLYDAIDDYPDENAFQQILTTLAEERNQLIIASAEQGLRSKTDELLLEQATLFNREPQSVRDDRERRAAQILKRVDLLAQAKQQLDENKVSVPAGDNAVSSLQSVLAIEPGLEEANRMLEEIAAAYLSGAEKLFVSKEFDKASVAVERALKARPSFDAALQLREQVRLAISRKQKIERHLAQAAAYSEHGFLYTPEGANAYDEYQLVLDLDEENQEALAGRAELLDKLSVVVWQYVGDARFEEASSLLARPLGLMPDNQRLVAMSAAISEVSP